MKYLINAYKTILSSYSVNQILEHLKEPLGKFTEDERVSKAKEIRKLMTVTEADPDGEVAMDTINEILGGYGVETLRSDDANDWDGYYGDAIAVYVNFGETYDNTVVYDIRNEEFILTSWGDFIEQREVADSSDNALEEEE